MTKAFYCMWAAIPDVKEFRARYLLETQTESNAVSLPQSNRLPERLDTATDS
jgi:hypothetical protein